jgi:glucokinase
MDTLIGVDVGGTNIVCGILTPEGNLLDTNKVETEAEKGSDYVIRKIKLTIEDLLSRNQLSIAKARCIGIGTPGFVNPIEGVSNYSVNLNWSHIPLAKILSESMHLPVFIDNDVRMYVLGEAIVGAGRGYDHVLGITIGTGLAAASVNQGRLFYGGGFMAGELGHIPVEGIHQKCVCGLNDCLEIFVSAPGLVRQVQSRIAAGDKSMLTERHSDLSTITAADISMTYDLNDLISRQVFKKTGELLAKGLASAIPLLSPDVVVIGGGLAFAGERLLAPLRNELQRLIHPEYLKRINITTAAHIDFAGVIGSGLNAMQRMNQNDGLNPAH